MKDDLCGISFAETGLSQRFLTSWKNAILLLHENNSIKEAAGKQKAFVVASLHSNTNYYVHPYQNGYRCNCPGYNTQKLCYHSLAVAAQNGDLQSFIEWFTTVANLTNITVKVGKYDLLPKNEHF